MKRYLVLGTALGAFLALFVQTAFEPRGRAQPGTPGYQPPATVIVPYNGASVDPKQPWSGDDVRRMLGYLKSMDERLANIESGPARAPGTLTQLDPLKVATGPGLCITCHTPSAAPIKGGDFALFANDEGTGFKPFSAREKARIKDAVESGQMPPPAKGKLSPAEKAAFQFGPAVSNKEFPK